ncbi:MAG: hypothetical protein AB2L07_15665 [Thermoanaerobaculaceae bacterium]
MTEISDARTREIERLLSLPTEGLYGMIGHSWATLHPGLRLPGSPEEEGQAIFENLLEDLRHKVCVEWDYPRKRKDAALQNTVDLVAAIADIVAGLTIGLPPFVVSVLLVRRGLDALCKCS